MLENIGNSDQEINKKKKREKNPGGMTQEIFLNAESQKQRQPETYSRKNMKY